MPNSVVFRGGGGREALDLIIESSKLVHSLGKIYVELKLREKQCGSLLSRYDFSGNNVYDDDFVFIYRRSSNDLIMRMNIELVEALCGFQRVIKTLDDRDLVITAIPGEFFS
jgi:DnaJ-class molecular chaperone